MNISKANELYRLCEEAYGVGMVSLDAFAQGFQGGVEDKEFVANVFGLVAKLNFNFLTRCFGLKDSPLILIEDSVPLMGNPDELTGFKNYFANIYRQ